MSPEKLGVVYSPVDDGGLSRLTPLYRCRYVIDPRHQQIFRDATGRTRGSRGLYVSLSIGGGPDATIGRGRGSVSDYSQSTPLIQWPRH